jgi:diguanylate cyclase (GGDEF)-like protein
MIKTNRPQRAKRDLLSSFNFSQSNSQLLHQSMLPLASFCDFSTASTEVMHYLHERLGFQLWMVTRTESDNWIVLNSLDHGYGVKNGDVFRWTDSFCSRMVDGLGPRIAPKCDRIPAYAEAPIGQVVPIGAYVGVPLMRNNGGLFGTLCAIDPQSMPDEIESELPLVELLARLLSTILESELKVQDEFRRAERAQLEAVTDGLTGLVNRRGWETLLAKEEKRCKRYGYPACLFSIDLDGLKLVNDGLGHAKGDELLKRFAEALLSVSRESDVTARIGGDEFALLAVECDLTGALALNQRLEQAFDRARISASVGMAMWHMSGTMNAAFEQADQNMYECKQRRKQKFGLSTKIASPKSDTPLFWI